MFFARDKTHTESNTKANKSTNIYNSLDAIYFKNLDELEKWYFEITSSSNLESRLYDEFRIATEQYGMYDRKDHRDKSFDEYGNEDGNGHDFHKKKHDNFLPKLIFIHDFANGYQDNEDSKSVGYFPHPTGSRFFMQFPQYVDEFVYFTHHRISIPPVTWINTCHRNKIKCLGTIIFEGNTMKDFVELDRFVDNDFKFVEYLTKLVDYFQFDGFLINIETVFSQVRLSKRLVPFINKLRNELSILDSKNEIIWYDSYILDKNKIKYVNGVSSENYVFFNNSDAFLTNYWWNINNLHENIKNVGILGVSSKLFLGCDVWGRGNLIGGGGFDIPLNLREAVKYKSNIGLFAPAWTYEYLDKKDFLRNNTKFWVGLEDNDSPKDDLSVSTYLSSRNSSVFKTNKSGFIFYTNFSNGEGQRFFQGDTEIFSSPWIDNNLQFEIPIECYRDDKSGIQLKLSKSDSVFGGSCLKFRFSELHDDTRDKNLKILNNFTRNKVRLFKFNRELKFDIIGVKYSIKVARSTHPSTGKFQLNLRYFIEKRYPSSNMKTRVRSGSFIIPLVSNCIDKWEAKEQFLQSSIMKKKNEFIILEDIELVYIEPERDKSRVQSVKEGDKPYEVKNIRSAIEDSEYDELMDFNGFDQQLQQDKEDGDWVFVTKDAAPVVAIVNDSKYMNHSKGKYFGTSFKSISQSKSANSTDPLLLPKTDRTREDSYVQDNIDVVENGSPKIMNSPIIKIGDLAIVNTDDYRSGNYFNIKRVDKVTKVEVKRRSTGRGGDAKVLIKWDMETYGVLNYLCYVDGEFRGLTPVNVFELDHHGQDHDGYQMDYEDRNVSAGLLGKKIRIDTMDRLGNLTKGLEIGI